MFKFLVAIVALAAAGVPVIAQEHTLGRAGTDTVFVWKGSEEHSEALSLISAGVHKTNPMLVFQLMSCMVPSGTKAIVTDMGFASHTILITSGEHAGCRGVIPMEDLR